MADFAHTHFRALLADGTVAGFTTASTWKLMLVSTGWTGFPSSCRATLDVVGVSGMTTDHPQFYEPSTTTGYERQTLSTAWQITEDDPEAQAEVDNNDVTFTSVSSGAGVIGAAVLFVEIATNDSSGRRLVSTYETGFPVTPNGGDITIAWSTGGVVQLASSS